ncbi:hypothetical protein GCM10023189_54140 [Nibrella saemangeumensis]|uniref:Uncharacterized protein n=1 Tax=Nibrella saemangeumensis TaxID=1084526 RepID=A0ABP8NN28_9BACT
MQKHPIDDLFGRQLKQASLKPSADAWARLQERQGYKKRPVAMWWYASAAACLLLVGLTGWWLWQTNLDITLKAGIAKQAGKVQPQITQPQPDDNAYPAAKEQANEPVIASVDKKAGKKTGGLAQPSADLTSATAEAVKPAEELAGKNTNSTEAEPVVVARAVPVQEKAVAPVVLSTEEKTLIVQLAPPQEMSGKAYDEGDHQSEGTEQSNKKKRTKMGRILRQLNNLREGEPIDWQEVGVQPGNLLAKASKTVDEGREKISDSYENIRSNAFKKHAEEK